MQVPVRRRRDFRRRSAPAGSRPMHQEIEPISGIEEARLIYQGVVHGLASPVGRKLVVDIGGGSTELIAGKSFDAVRMESLYLGCVSMSRTYFPDGEMTSRRWKRAELEVETAYLRAGGYTLRCS